MIGEFFREALIDTLFLYMVFIIVFFGGTGLSYLYRKLKEHGWL